MKGNRLWVHIVLFMLLKDYQCPESHQSLFGTKYLAWLPNTIKKYVPDVLEVPTWTFIVGDRNIEIQNLRMKNLKELLIERTKLRKVTQENGTILARFALELTGVKMKGVIDVSGPTGHLRQGQMQVSFSGRGRFSATLEESSCLAAFKATVTVDDPKYNGQQPIIQGDPKKLNFELRKEVTKVINQKLTGATVKLSQETCQEIFGSTQILPTVGTLKDSNASSMNA